jgi:hypothetical protein
MRNNLSAIPKGNSRSDMEQFELDEGDCEDMVRLFATGPVTVKKIEGRYFLQIPELKLPVGNTQVPDAAQEALSLLNGIARLELGNFCPPKILGFSNTNPHTGKLQTFMSLSGKCEARSRSYATVTVRLSDGTIATNQAPRSIHGIPSAKSPETLRAHPRYMAPMASQCTKL